jgi:chemotaxis protein CheY-P-specific phosphatase CheC
MQDQKTTTLTTVLSEVLSDLAFMFTDDGESDPPVGERWLDTSVSYQGPVSGSLRLLCTGTFAAELASNLLGTDPESEPAEQESIDAVKEFMNIVCGQYVTAAYGTEDVFNLTIPEVSALPTTPVLGSLEDVSEDLSLLSVDGQWLQLLHTRT